MFTCWQCAPSTYQCRVITSASNVVSPDRYHAFSVSCCRHRCWPNSPRWSSSRETVQGIRAQSPRWTWRARLWAPSSHICWRLRAIFQWMPAWGMMDPKTAKRMRFDLRLAFDLELQKVAKPIEKTGRSRLHEEAKHNQRKYFSSSSIHLQRKHKQAARSLHQRIICSTGDCATGSGKVVASASFLSQYFLVSLVFSNWRSN